MARAKPERVGALSPRQREVAVLIARGYRTKEIAKRLGLSARTVEMTAPG